MESPPQKTLERYVSQKALQMSSSFPCQICVASFLCGVCFTYFSLAALGSFGTVEFGTVYSAPSMPVSQNSTSLDREMGRREYYIPKDINIGTSLPRSLELDDIDRRVSMLHSAWSTKLEVEENKEHEFINSSNLPDAPHLEDCKMNMLVNRRLDSRGENGSLPPWTIWKGLLGLELLQPVSRAGRQQSSSKLQAITEMAYPPWISGSDEDNIPYTRRVQHDIWVHQHPPNCSDSQVHFLVADWERLPGFGIGAQIAGMCGLLAIAIKEKRVLVTNYFNRADHNGCKGPSRSHWSCYFLPETSKECQDRAFALVTRREAWETGIVTGKVNYTSKEIWSGQIPRAWGSPWSYLQPTTEIDGNLLMHHRKMDRRWWRAQAVRYLMRFQSKYTCGLLNTARHEAFGMQAARMVLASLGEEWLEVPVYQARADIERFVWSNHKPWMPRPLLSMHVRMGDKASEMKVVGFEEYMVLAERIRKRFPDLNAIWLSTEMQEVIDQTKLYPHWNFYYTNVPRQAGNMTMAAYESSLGRVTSTNYPLTNFLMASEADFFIGALGSTWCFLIDGMRTTGGKVMAGYLSVNKDRFW